MRLSPILFLLAALGASAASAQDTPYDRYAITAEASGEVANDQMVATLAVQDEDADPAALADRVNRAMAAALETLEDHPAVTAKTLDYRTEPRYDKGPDRKLVGWRAVQTLELRTTDLAAGAKAVSELQSALVVQDTRLQPSTATRRAAEDALIGEALDAFTARAELVRRTMGATDHRVVQADVQTEGSRGPVYARSASRSMALESDVAEPALAAGTSELTVRVYGTIELSR